MKKRIIKIRKSILVFLTHKIALPLLKLVRKPNTLTHSAEDLKNLPKGTLGNDLYVFLTQRNLPFLKHYARHDLKHVLLGYETTEEGEACLLSFMLGNGRVSFPVLATVIYSFLTMPEYRGQMQKAFSAGKKSIPIHKWKWNEIVRLQTSDIRKKIFTND